MRIQTRIAAGGDRALTRIPYARTELKNCLNSDGKIDRSKAQRAFACGDGDGDYIPFTPASSDDETVYFAALTFLELFHDAYKQVMERGEGAEVSDGARTRQDQRLEAKMDRGKFVYARTDIKRTAGGVRVKLTVGNPHNVVGQAEQEAWTFTKTCAQLWMRIKAQVPWVELECERADVLAAAKADNDRASARRKYAQCDRRQNGYCSPPNCDCPFFKVGRCGYGK